RIGARRRPTPVDPGEHSVEAFAAGHRPWSARVRLEAGETAEVAVPALVPLPRPAAVLHSVPPPPRRVRWRRPAAVAAGAAGLVALGATTILALDASAQYDNAAAAHCDA